MWYSTAVVTFVTHLVIALSNPMDSDKDSLLNERKKNLKDKLALKEDNKSFHPFEKLDRFKQDHKAKIEARQEIYENGIKGLKSAFNKNLAKTPRGSFNVTSKYEEFKRNVKREVAVLMKEKERQFEAVKQGHVTVPHPEQASDNHVTTTAVPVPSKPELACPPGSKRINGVCVVFS